MPKGGRMGFYHRPLSPPLDRFVESIWYCRSEPRPRRLERVLPNGAPQLIFNLSEDVTRTYSDLTGNHCRQSSGNILSGIATRFQVIDTDEQEHVVGVSFRPGGTVGFFGVPAHELADADVPLDALWGRALVSELREQLLEAPNGIARLDRLERALIAAHHGRSIHAAVAYSLSTFQRHPTQSRVREVVDQIGLSAKAFTERFKRDVGVPPKVYCRILRFQEAVGRAYRSPAIDWTRVALDSGYYDQAHFIHDFRAFAGQTPGDYRAARTEFQNHVAVDR